jgi:hypothetical protein
MKTLVILRVAIAFAILLSGFVHGNRCHAEEGLTPGVPSAHPFGRLPLSFELNHGQVDGAVKFISRARGYTLFLTEREAVMVWPGNDAAGAVPARRDRVSQARIEENVRTGSKPVTLRMHLVGAQPSSSVRGAGELPGKVNYFIGNDPSRWRTNIPTFTHVRLGQVYPGIDLVYYGNQSDLEYDFVVAPGADPGVIELTFDGADRVELDAAGQLLLRVGDEEVHWRPPHVYQEGNGTRQDVAASYRLRSTPEVAAEEQTPRVAFQVAGYDTTRPLVIDPVLVYSTYVGGGADDVAYGIAVDSSGSAYVTGSTFSLDFPTANPIQPEPLGDEAAFVTKLSPAGDTMIFSTYLGGSGSGLINEGHAIAVDPGGSVLVTGPTGSTDFPVFNALQPTFGGGTKDAFVAKLSPDGAGLVFSTYLGGSGGDTPWAIALDSATNIYVAGSTTSADFPTVAPIQPRNNGVVNGFVAKLDAQAQHLVYSTYLGGSASDLLHGLAVDGTMRAYVTGWTTSSNFPTVNAIQAVYGGGVDNFVARLDANGSSLEYSTYLGGNAGLAGAIAVDPAGSAYVTGTTSSTNLPTTPGVVQARLSGATDAYVAKLNAAGSAFDYLTYLGGTDIDLGQAIAIDAAGNAYAAGRTSSTNFPTRDPIQALPAFTPNDQNDGFVAKLSPDGSALVWSTYFGGSDLEDQLSLVLDSAGGVYVSGRTRSSDFPTQNALQPSLGGANDAFVAKLAQPPPPVVGVARSGSIVTITWPTNAVGFILEQSITLAGAPVWSPSTNLPVVVGDQNTVTIQADGAMQYFRLIKQ